MLPLKLLKKAAAIGITVLFCSTSAQAAVTWTTWANTNGTEGTANAEYRTLNLQEYLNGLGAVLDDSPRHAFDNNGVHDFILLELDMPITLTDLQIGWKGENSNMTIMAFTAASFTRSDMNNRNSDLSDDPRTTRGPTNAGWEFISNPRNIQTDTLSSSGNTNNINSSYWLAGSYNHYFNGNHQ